MAEKTARPPSMSSSKPVPMKLFAAWEADRTPSNCNPRLCTLTMTRLVVLKPLGSDVPSIIVAVKMQCNGKQNMKRTLRSNEVTLSATGLVDTELELTFSLQYPHFLKRDGNVLQVMLQRRKRYKNRTILGFKTLAVGFVDMAHVLQRSMDRELELFTDVKEKASAVAKVHVLALSSQPVDHEENTTRHKMRLSDSADRTADVDPYSDEEEDYSSNDEGSDSEPMMDDGLGHHPLARHQLGPGRKHLPAAARQKNFKQKFIALLKKFKVTDEVLDSEHDHEEIQDKIGQEMDPQDIEDLFDEIEDLSESGPEMDTMSVSSTPKPSLRPFFASSRSLAPESLSIPDKGADRLSDESSKKADSDSHPETWTDHEHSDPPHVSGSPPRVGTEDRKASERKSKLFAHKDKSSVSSKDKERKSMSSGTGVSAAGTGREKVAVERCSAACQMDTAVSIFLPICQGSYHSGKPGELSKNGVHRLPRKLLLEQLAKIFSADDFIPDHMVLVNTTEALGQALAQRLTDKQHRVLSTCTAADVKAAIACLFSRIQKFCNNSSKAPMPIRIALVGGDALVSFALRAYVEQLTGKPLEWQGYVRFLVIPLGHSSLAKYLGSIDGTYQSNFVDPSWRDAYDKSDSQKIDYQEMVNRTSRYLTGSGSVVHVAIAEAMVTYKEKSSDDESSQIFLPFINDVRVGLHEAGTSTSVDLDESCQGPLIIQTSSSSPPSASGFPEKPRENLTPPNSPIVASTTPHVTGLNVMSQTPSGTQTSSSLGPPSSGATVISSSGASPGNVANVPGSPGIATTEKVNHDPLDLQVDYWIAPMKSDSSKKPEPVKCTMKATFRSLKLTRLPNYGELAMPTLSMHYITKEKKQKIMRLGKRKEKEKDTDQLVEGIHRLICLTRTQPLKLKIDGVEWHGVKFFQLSAQWQTHIKNLPLVLFSTLETTTS